MSDSDSLEPPKPTVGWAKDVVGGSLDDDGYNEEKEDNENAEEEEVEVNPNPFPG